MDILMYRGEEKESIRVSEYQSVCDAIVPVHIYSHIHIYTHAHMHTYITHLLYNSYLPASTYSTVR